jgi:transposase
MFQSQLFYLFNLERRIPERHLLRRINPTVTRIFAEFREKLEPFYSEIGRPAIDPDLMIRMLIVGCCYGIRFERKLCEEVELHLAYRPCARRFHPITCRQWRAARKSL